MIKRVTSLVMQSDVVIFHTPLFFSFVCWSLIPEGVYLLEDQPVAGTDVQLSISRTISKSFFSNNQIQWAYQKLAYILVKDPSYPMSKFAFYLGNKHDRNASECI